MVATSPRIRLWEASLSKGTPGGGELMRLPWLILVLSLCGCGGGKPATTLSVTCARGTQLIGAASVDVLGDLANGLPTMNFPDPANPGQTGTISVQPHDHCKIAPTSGPGS